MRICVSPRIQEYFGHALVRGEWTRTWRPVTSRTVAGRGRRVPAASGPTASAALRLLLLRVEQQLPALLLARRLVVAARGLLDLLLQKVLLLQQRALVAAATAIAIGAFERGQMRWRRCQAIGRDHKMAICNCEKNRRR